MATETLSSIVFFILLFLTLTFIHIKIFVHYKLLKESKMVKDSLLKLFFFPISNPLIWFQIALPFPPSNKLKGKPYYDSARRFTYLIWISFSLFISLIVIMEVLNR